MDTEKRLNQMESMIEDTAFRHNRGLSNEVGYYIFDYPPKDELIIRDYIKRLQGKATTEGTLGFSLEVFDLYDMVLDILEEKQFLEQCFKFEEKQGMDRIVRAVGNMLKLSDNTGLIVEKIRSRLAEREEDATVKFETVIFITGIGKIYPVLRSHKVLNNLHQAIDDIPVVMFYPGRYDEQKLMLFGTLQDDNYYRAFRLVD
ncbi:MAG: DUF1788 domain-containing protein [Clostridiales Family XIII bacterium]|nr:DUF1788 domain-containing protein [Clostridiales Family XIII bacterium]